MYTAVIVYLAVIARRPRVLLKPQYQPEEHQYIQRGQQLMQTERLTLATLWVRTIAVARQKAGFLLGWGLVAILLCLPCAMLFIHLSDLGSEGTIDPVSLWRSLTPLGKLGIFLSIWFMSFGLLGLTQAVATLTTWDACTNTPTSLSKLATSLLRRLHRILGLQLVVLLMIVILVPLSVFAIPAILLDNCDVFKGIGRSTNMWHRHPGKTILILSSALVVAIGERLALGPVATPQGHSSLILALALEARMGLFYLAGVVIGIPTTLLYCQSRESLQSPARQQRVAPGGKDG